MAQHDALRRAAGAGGVDQARERVAVDPARVVDRRSGAGGQRLVPAGDGRPGARRGRRFDGDHPPQRRRVRRGGEQPFAERRARHDGHDGARVRQHVRVVARGVGGIRRHGDSAGGHDGEVGDRPVRRVFRTQQHPVARRQAPGPEGAGQRAHPVRRLAPRQRPPRAVALLPDERSVAEAFGLGEEHRHQIGPAVQLHRPTSRPPVGTCASAGYTPSGTEREET